MTKEWWGFFLSSSGISSLISPWSQIILPKKKKKKVNLGNLEQSKPVREYVNNCVVCRRQGAMQGSLCEERPGLPHARHSWFHPGPGNPLQGTDECLKGILEILHRQWGKKWETFLQTERWQRNVRGEGQSGCPRQQSEGSIAAHERPQWRRYAHCSPWRTPCHSKWKCTEGSCSPWERPTLE